MERERERESVIRVGLSGELKVIKKLKVIKTRQKPYKKETLNT
jgi:hypothetical protein